MTNQETYEFTMSSFLMHFTTEAFNRAASVENFPDQAIASFYLFSPSISSNGHESFEDKDVFGMKHKDGADDFDLVKVNQDIPFIDQTDQVMVTHNGNGQYEGSFLGAPITIDFTNLAAGKALVTIYFEELDQGSNSSCKTFPYPIEYNLNVGPKILG